MRWIAILAVALLTGCATAQTSGRIELETKAPDYLPTVKIVLELKR